jgi:hypothetical protein
VKAPFRVGSWGISKKMRVPGVVPLWQKQSPRQFSIILVSPSGWAGEGVFPDRQNVCYSSPGVGIVKTARVFTYNERLYAISGL